MTSITKEDVLKDPLTLGRCFKEHAEPHGHLTRAWTESILSAEKICDNALQDLSLNELYQVYSQLRASERDKPLGQSNPYETMALRKIKSVVCDIPEVKSQLQYRGVLAMMASRVDQRINHLVGTPHGQVPTNAYEALEQVVKARPAP